MNKKNQNNMALEQTLLSNNSSEEFKRNDTPNVSAFLQNATSSKSEVKDDSTILQKKLPSYTENISRDPTDLQYDLNNNNVDVQPLQPLKNSNGTFESSERSIFQQNQNVLIDIKEKLNYRYIDDDVLSKNFNICSNDINSFTLYFCIYSINTECYIEGIPQLDDSLKLNDINYIYNHFQPFIQYIFEKKNNSILSLETYHFPSKQYTCPVFTNQENIENESQREDSNDISQEQIHFQNSCFEFLLSCFDKNINDTIHKEKIDFRNLYKGFIQEDENKENIFVFFDISKIISYLNTNYTLAIMDEIIYKKKIYSTPMDEFVIQFFKKNDSFTKIYILNNDDDENIPEKEVEVLFPFQLYLCDYVNNEYINIDNSYDLKEVKPLEHPFLGMAYYFSTSPLKEVETENLKRFSCFMVNDLYFKKDISNINEEESEESEESEVNIQSEEEENDKKDPTKEYIKEEILYASTLYFHENELQLWGIKNITHFIKY
jgi:hypothetical protein